MSDQPEPRFRPGVQPYDPLNGMRIGGLAGGVVGAIATAILGAAFGWLILAGAFVGGAAGYAWAKRSMDDGNKSER